MSKSVKSNSIRVIAGNWRGRRLPVLEADGLRPTTDRVRETLFNWLMHDVAGSRCLDVFAGTGALGLECLSRGAESVQFYEANPLVVGKLKQNIKLLEANKSASRAVVTQGDAVRFLSKKAVSTFDLVFLDPPFKDDVIGKCMQLLEANGWLSESALIYTEYDKKLEFSLPPSWKLYREGRTKQSKYQLYHR